MHIHQMHPKPEDVPDDGEGTARRRLTGCGREPRTVPVNAIRSLGAQAHPELRRKRPNPFPVVGRVRAARATRSARRDDVVQGAVGALRMDVGSRTELWRDLYVGSRRGSRRPAETARGDLPDVLASATPVVLVAEVKR